MKNEIIAGLHEASGEVLAAAIRNTPVDTSQLKNSWAYKVDENKLESAIGNPLERAIWAEFGTGEYALNGNGRKGGWLYEDRHGETHFTKGQRPKRMLHNAFVSEKQTIRKAIEKRVENLDK